MGKHKNFKNRVKAAIDAELSRPLIQDYSTTNDESSKHIKMSKISSTVTI